MTTVRLTVADLTSRMAYGVRMVTATLGLRVPQRSMVSQRRRKIMHAHRTRGPGARGWVGVVLTVTFAASMLTLPAPAFAAYAYSGGPTQATTSLFVPNDSTPFAVQITAPAGSGLPAGTTEYVKPRFSPQNKPASTLNRGSVWNRVTGRWVSEQDPSWSDFPTITINPDGSLPTGPESWLYMRFGDDTQDDASSGAAGGWFLFVSISIGVQGNTYNNTADLPEASIMTSQTSVTTTNTTSWVHNVASTGLGANTAVAATSVGSTSSVDECVRTEPNGVDDDFDGVIDNEGPLGNRTGDFRMAVPAATHFDVRTGDANQTVVAGWTNVVSGPTDTDIALGASDMVPPGAPGALQATNGYGRVRLGWSAATDNVAVTGYNVYRWADNLTPDIGNGPPILSATSPHVRIGTTTGVSFDDTSALVGQTYHYEVRAVDAATNVGPRSSTADGVANPPDTTPPSTTISGLPTSTPLSGPFTFSLAATDTQSGVANTFYTLDGSSATTYTAPVLVATVGPHSLTYWSVDQSGNAETPHTAGAASLATSITIKTTTNTTTIGKTPILSGAVTPLGMIGQNIVVYVMKPGKTYWTYSSNRTTYALSGGAAWQYKYTFKAGMTKGVYKFKAVVPAWPGFLTSTSSTISIRLK